MIDLLASFYSVIKALHVISVIAWMAGLFYLPRLFVYHEEQVGQTGPTHEMFLTMERRLLQAIMTPAMISTWIFGLLLASIPGVIDWAAIWPWTKLASVLAMTWFHFWLSSRRKEFVTGQNTRSGRTYRIMNEVPTLLMVVIVFSVFVRF